MYLISSSYLIRLLDCLFLTCILSAFFSLNLSCNSRDPELRSLGLFEMPIVEELEFWGVIFLDDVLEGEAAESSYEPVIVRSVDDVAN